MGKYCGDDLQTLCVARYVRPFPRHSSLLTSASSDLTTRRGLRKVEEDFDNIYQRLDNMYVRYSNIDKVKGAVVGICAKMCLDAVLQDKLFKVGT